MRPIVVNLSLGTDRPTASLESAWGLPGSGTVKPLRCSLHKHLRPNVGTKASAEEVDQIRVEGSVLLAFDCSGLVEFDQILFPALLTSLYVNDSFRIFDAGVAIEGTGGQDGDQASDHLPVYADFVFGGTGGGDGGGEMPILGVRIASLLANPEGVDEGRESLTLINQATTTIDLSGWKLRDRAGGEAPVFGQLATGARTTVILPRSLALNNNGDEVALIGSDGIERHRVSYTGDQVFPGQEIDF